MENDSTNSNKGSSNERIVLNFHGKKVAFYSRDLSVLSSGMKRGTKFFIDNDGVYESSYSFKHFDCEINLCGLIRVHKSYYINPDKFHEYISADEIIILTNGRKIPLGKKYKHAFLEWMKELSKTKK